LKSVDKRVILGIVIGLALMIWFAVDVDFGDLIDALRKVKPGWIVLASIIMLFEWIFRGLRWAVLVRKIDSALPLWLAISATLIGGAVNTLVPLRGGDLVRPAVVARARNLPYATVLSTTIVERLLDLFGVIVVIGVMLAVLPKNDDATVQDLRRYGLIAAGIGVLLIVVVATLATRQARSLVERLLRRAPERVTRRVLGTFDELVVGLAIAGQPLRLAVSAGFTLGIWAVGVLAISCLFRAFALELPLSAALTLAVVLPVSLAAPGAPGGLGAFQLAMEKTLVLWDAPVAQAQAAAIVFWAVCLIPATMWGLFEAWRQGLGLFDAKAELLEDLEEREREALKR
jgi:uncharacterized protein (TIRG00374 family)